MFLYQCRDLFLFRLRTGSEADNVELNRYALGKSTSKNKWDEVHE